MSKYYYHGTDKLSFYKILETGEIKCRRLIEEENIEINRSTENIVGVGANGYEYISVCSKNDYFDGDDSFNVFIRNSYCFIISDDIEAIKTINISDEKNNNKYKKEYWDFAMNNSESTIRFSIMSDEYHVKTSIPLSKIIGIGFPFKSISNSELDLLFNIAYKLNFDVVNTADSKFIEKYEKRKIGIEKIKKLSI